MKKINLLAATLAIAGLLDAQAPLYPNYPSETPANFKPSTGSFDYVTRDVNIPMRDGVK